MKAVFLDYDTVSYGDLDPAPLREVLPGLVLCAGVRQSEVAALIDGAAVVYLNKLRLTAEHFAAAPALRLVALAATGTDNIDLEAARARGVAVCNVSGYCTTAVAQHVWGLILCLTQHLFAYHRFSIDGSWARDADRSTRAPPIHELSGRTLGVVGWGQLGRGVAAIAAAFGMHVVIANRPGGAAQEGRLPLRELLRVADVVSLHCPLTAATRRMIGAPELALMKPDAMLINTARGGLVDAAALRAALVAGRLAGAGIDVLEHEPPADGDPLLDQSVPNLIVTPHVAWAAREARQRCLAEMAANTREFLVGGRRMRVV